MTDPKDTTPPEPRAPFPPRIRERFDSSGLVRRFFEVGSEEMNYAEANPDICDVGREYLSLSEHEHLVAAARSEVYAEELPRLKEWIEAYHTDFFVEKKGPYTDPQSAAAAMGRHILGLLIKEFEARLPGKGVERPGEEK